jgi:hypothetical protein
VFAGERELVAALRIGDEAAFSTLVEMYHTKMLRLARTMVGDAIVAEEVTQEAWLGVLRGLARFEGRSSLQTWIFTILGNCARAPSANGAPSPSRTSLPKTKKKEQPWMPDVSTPPGRRKDTGDNFQAIGVSFLNNNFWRTKRLTWHKWRSTRCQPTSAL